ECRSAGTELKEQKMEHFSVTGQVALEQHVRELTAQEGTGVTFQCSMSGDDMSDYFMYWYQQGPGGSLEWIYQAGDTYGEGFQGQFKGSVESSQNRFTLQIEAAKQGNEAVYFCGARDFSAFFSSRCQQR
uniref:Ig-like domain-containing protein n=1 Tax=Calidris pygmaea TaxID=425635 RepID=A0A8C3KMF1_9CHAR